MNARLRCLEEGADLASIPNLSYHGDLMSLFGSMAEKFDIYANIDNYWLGGVKSGGLWEWLGGNYTMDYTAWHLETIGNFSYLKILFRAKPSRSETRFREASFVHTGG